MPESNEAPSTKAAGRSVRRELVEREIMENATRLFAERGLAATTLQDIAEATGLTRPALYHYVANKDELFARLVSEIAEAPAILLHGINERTDLDTVSKLRTMATAIAGLQAQHPDRFRLLIRSEAELPAEIAESYRLSRRRVLRELAAVIDDGIVAGVFRPMDARTAALGIIGMVNWIAWWYRPGDDSQQIAEQLADMAVRSVVLEDDTASGVPMPERLFGELRRNLDDLERFVGRSAPPP